MKRYSLETKNNKSKCVGVLVRGIVNIYLHDNVFMENRGFRILKNKSCGGCESCGWILDNLNEFYHNDEPISNLHIMENKKLYEITYVELSRDFETGYVDDYHFELVEIKEKLNEK